MLNAVCIAWIRCRRWKNSQRFRKALRVKMAQVLAVCFSSGKNVIHLKYLTFRHIPLWNNVHNNYKQHYRP